MHKVLRLIVIGTFMLTAASAVSIAVCKGCHGQKWEKTPMEKSKVVRDMSKAEIINALKGYKDGSYGGEMKGLMQPQVSKLSIKDIEKIAASIKE